MIPYGRQCLDEEDHRAVTAVLNSDWLTQGPAVERFEQSLCAVTGAKHAITVNSATSALHIACKALEVGPGDLVWTSPNTFVATANAARFCGAEVDFVDIDPDTYNLDVNLLEAKLQHAANRARLPKVVIPVHFAGQPCDMRAIRKLADQYHFLIIEDASHAIGAHYHGEPIGNGRYADITVFSFHPVKIITSAEGGAALTNDSNLAQYMALVRSHMVTRNPALMTHNPDGPWYYQQIGLGYNYRLTDLQAALGMSQMLKLEDFIAARHRLAERYDHLLANLPLVLPYQQSDRRSALHLFPIRVDPAIRLQIFQALRARDILVNVHYIPVHTQPYYQDLGFKPGDFPKAEAYYAGAISLPLFACMKDAEQDMVVKTLSNAFHEIST